MRRMFLLLLGLSAVLFPAGCATTSPSTQVISVMVSPPAVSVPVGQKQTFTANVTGTSNMAVSWSVVGGATNGSITATGVYTAPSTVPSPPQVVVKATSQADSTKSGSATVTVTSQSSSTVSVSPSAVSVEVFMTQQFFATINGQPSTAINWQVNGVTAGSATSGTISTGGLYHAPNAVPTTTNSSGDVVAATVKITAVSQANPASTGSATVTVFAPNQTSQAPPVKLGTTGGNANDSSTSGNTITCCGGTLGSLLSRGGNQFILSNNHVLACTDGGPNGTQCPNGSNIIQPGLIDANCGSAGTTTVGHLSQSLSLEANSDHPVADAAIAQVVSGTVDSQGTILELGGTTSGGLPTDGPPAAGSGVAPAVNQAVAKSGRTTGLTCSTIAATSVTVSIMYQKGCGTGTTFTATYSGQVSVAGGNFSAEGDSGSLIVTQGGAQPVALLFAGSDVDSVGNPVSVVLNALADPTTHAVPVFVGSSSTHPVAACSLPGPQAAMAARLTVQKVTPSGDALVRGMTVRDAHAAELMGHSEVQAIGVGASYDNAGEAAILLFVTKGQPRTNLPATVDGIRTRIIEGDIFAKRGALTVPESAELEQSAAPPQLVYSISDAEMARAKFVHAAHVDELMKMPGVQGVGITSSVDSPGEAALMIYLIRGAAHPAIPPLIDGLRTRVRESSRFRAGFGDDRPKHGCSVPAAKKTQPSPAPGSKP